MIEKKDWLSWHNKYHSSSDLGERLSIVRSLIERSLPNDPKDIFKILDICAGDGRDLIPVLRDYPSQKQIVVRLVEIDKQLADKASTAVIEAGLDNVEVVVNNAADIESYRDFLPADMILLCGVFGNISNSDVEYVISKLPMLCKKDAKVVWTRNRREPDATPWIRELFIRTGFMEADFVAPPNITYAVGVNTYSGSTQQLEINQKLFTFLR